MKVLKEDVPLFRSHSALFCFPLQHLYFHLSKSNHAQKDLKLALINSQKIRNTSPSVHPPPPDELCRPAAARLCPCTWWWDRQQWPGVAPSLSRAPGVALSARLTASCASHLLHRTEQQTVSVQCLPLQKKTAKGSLLGCEVVHFL